MKEEATQEPVLSELDELEAHLGQVAERWMAMISDTAGPEGRRGISPNADGYYREEVFPLVQKVFSLRERPKISRRYHGLILSVGTSPEPLILSISAIQPEQVLFLHTEGSGRHLETIVRATGLKQEQILKRQISESEPLDIYERIKETYLAWGNKPIAVDFTGGTKAMTAVTAMAGSLIGADLVYIGNLRYLENARRPYPGSEYLTFIANPYSVFGDLEEREAARLFGHHDYEGAKRILAELEQRVPEPRRYKVFKSLAQAYEAWDALNFSGARDALAETVRLVRQFSQASRNFPLANRLGRMEGQISSLRRLAEAMPSGDHQLALDFLSDVEIVSLLVFVVYHNALRRQAQGKLDMAALLLYRVIEMVGQRRLASYGLDSAAPDYSKLAEKVSPDELVARINGLRKAAGGEWIKLTELPRQLALLQAYLVLTALEDPLTTNLALGRLRHLTETRNHNIYAHGFTFITEPEYRQFKVMVEHLLANFCSLENIDRESIEATIRFIDPWAQS